MEKNFGPEEFNRFIGKMPDDFDPEDYALTEDEVNDMLRRALGGSTAICQSCGGLCDHQVVQIRDSFMRRARELGAALVHGVDLYEATREFGIDEPESVIEKIYEIWCELWVLYRFLEPQDRLAEGIQEEGASPLED